MPGESISIPATDGSGSFSTYLTGPANKQAPAIVLLHEIYGVTGWVIETADLFAARGYRVAAPDIFWRLEPNFTADHRDSTSRDKGLRYRGVIDRDKAVEDIAALIGHLKTEPGFNGKVGVTGFCMGGTLTYLAASRLQIDAAVAYYGTQIHEHLDEALNISCPTMLHMGDRDDHVPEELSATIRDALTGVPEVTIHRYDAGHAFCNTHRDDHYQKEPSDLSHARTFEMFDRLR
jgi:carboxymethylenebutenolidase